MFRKVFGVGLNCTGSITQRDCLVPLGYRHLTGRRDLLLMYRAGNVAQVLQEADCFDSLEDWPWPLMYRELFEHYGDRARYILSRRSSAEAWLDHLKTLAAATRGTVNCRELAYGHDDPAGYEAEFLNIYERHLADVRAFFQARGASHLLLEVCWEEADSWEPLGELLGIPAPAIPFPQPNLNNRPLADKRIRSAWPHLPYLREPNPVVATLDIPQPLRRSA